MEIIERLVEIINIECEEPATLGGLHIIFVLAVIYAGALLVLMFSGARDGVYRLIVGMAFFVMLVMEIFKQVAYPMSIVDGEAVYEYVWRIFPFQLCSTPLYVFPILIFFNDGHIRDAAAAFSDNGTFENLYSFTRTFFNSVANLNGVTDFENRCVLLELLV